MPSSILRPSIHSLGAFFASSGVLLFFLAIALKAHDFKAEVDGTAFKFDNSSGDVHNGLSWTSFVLIAASMTLGAWGAYVKGPMWWNSNSSSV